MSPEYEIDAAARLYADPTNPIFKLLDFITKYSLPVKPLAAFLGIHPQTIYFWLASTDDIRPETTSTKKMDLLLDRLVAAEDAGLLVLSGPASARTQQLIDALGEHPALEPEST
jgi:hypothetical protein